MKEQKNDTRLDDMLARRLRREPAAFDFDEWARRFPHEAKLARSGFAGPDEGRRIRSPKVWRYIMESRYTKYAGVAAVVLVALAFLFPDRNAIVPESIAWADVQKAMEQIQTMRVTGTRNFFFGEDQTPTQKLSVEKLFSFSQGYVDQTFTEDGKLIIEFIYHLPTGTATVLFPTAKRYYRVQIPEARRDELQQITLEGLFEALFASGDYRQLEPKEVQGVRAVGFEVSDLTERLFGGLGGSQKIANFFFPVRSLNARVWVDPKARLPILVEAEGEVGPCIITGFRPMRLVEADDRWEFDIELDEAQFNPAIPEDYQELVLPLAAQAGAGLYGIGLASIPVVLVATKRSRTPRG